MDAVILTTISTILLVFAGFAQIAIMRAQRRQESLQLIETYRQRWRDSLCDWGTVIYFGGDSEDFYQIVDRESITQLESKAGQSNLENHPVWALDALKSVCGILSDICTKVLQGQLDIQDVYPALGTELLRYSRRLREILDAPCTTTAGIWAKIQPPTNS